MAQNVPNIKVTKVSSINRSQIDRESVERDVRVERFRFIARINFSPGGVSAEHRKQKFFG